MFCGHTPSMNAGRKHAWRQHKQTRRNVNLTKDQPHSGIPSKILCIERSEQSPIHSGGSVDRRDASITLGSGESGGQVDAMSSLSLSSCHSWTISAACQGEFSSCANALEVVLPFSGCICAYVSSDNHMNARTQQNIA